MRNEICFQGLRWTGTGVTECGDVDGLVAVEQTGRCSSYGKAGNRARKKSSTTSPDLGKPTKFTIFSF
jgi:hypothetical protein